ncbi:nuclear factor 7, brain-like [Morone saxatilis]|uniref:nuclear factor 7, brain-like n=1 Tax=Morone saxatilis TaxID=34816 RepID=UPI0015E1C92F|nr:nuclear factor 7, brain-like [Morone saxatilis]
MATASPFLSEDQFLCSICLDVFTEPVSIPCGHNFCKACITRHRESKEQCQCPLCNEKFNKGLKLRVNTGFREVVENFKKHYAIANNNQPIKPGQVPCDCCLDNNFKVCGVESILMQAPHLWCFHTEGLHPFHRYFFLPGDLGFSEGRFYYKVEVKGRTGWDLGVVRESVLRKRTFTPNTRNGSWIIRLENNTNYKALHNVPFNFFLSRKLERVMVFVDYDNGLVSFCDADTATMIYTFTGCKFQERIFLYYRPTEDVSSEQKLHILIFLFLIFLIWIWSN